MVGATLAATLAPIGGRKKLSENGQAEYAFPCGRPGVLIGRRKSHFAANLSTMAQIFDTMFNTNVDFAC